MQNYTTKGQMVLNKANAKKLLHQQMELLMEEEKRGDYETHNTAGLANALSKTYLLYQMPARALFFLILFFMSIYSFVGLIVLIKKLLKTN